MKPDETPMAAGAEEPEDDEDELEEITGCSHAHTSLAFSGLAGTFC